MKVKVSKLEGIVFEKFDGNQTKASKKLQISRTYLNQILNKKIKPNSPKVCNAIIKYCKENKEDEKEYIIF